MYPTPQPKQIPWLSAHANQGVEFHRFANTRAYLAQKSGLFPDTRNTLSRTRQLMERCAYGNLCKFRKHRTEWDLLERRVPLGYLEAIGVDREVLQFTVGLDVQQHARALHEPRFPRFASARLMACVHKSIEFPEDTSETEAIEQLKEKVAEIRVPWFINYPELLTVWVRPNGEVAQTVYTPSVAFTRTGATFSRGGHRLGMVSV